MVRLRDGSIASSLWSPQPLTNALAGLVMGLLAGIAALWLRRGLRAALVLQAPDLSRQLGTPILGSIPPLGGREA